MALPRDSYLQEYFTDLYDVLRVGPPLYFVVPHIQMDPAEPDINMVCSVGGCDDASFVNEVHRKHTGLTQRSVLAGTLAVMALHACNVPSTLGYAVLVLYSRRRLVLVVW